MWNRLESKRTFDIVTVCCSMTSCIATRSASFILSNSSMQTTQRSARTIAPALKKENCWQKRNDWFRKLKKPWWLHSNFFQKPTSSLRSPLSWSVVTAAVRPTPDDPLPVALSKSKNNVRNRFLFEQCWTHTSQHKQQPQGHNAGVVTSQLTDLQPSSNSHLHGYGCHSSGFFHYHQVAEE